MSEDTDLITALRQRDPDAFTQLFESYSDRIYGLGIKLLANEDEAAGVVQETFLSLIEKIDQFEGRANLSTWLYRVAYNACIDCLRKRRHDISLPEDMNEAETQLMPVILIDWRYAPEPLFTSVEAQQELDRAIMTLPDKYRAAFIFRDMEGLSTAETAEILNISVGTVKVQLHRARLMLREQLSAYFSERLTHSTGVRHEV